MLLTGLCFYIYVHV